MLIIVPTDGNYLEPAFITINSIALHVRSETRVCLLYLKSTDENDSVFEPIIAAAQADFSKIYPSKLSLQSIAVRSTYFKDFTKFHLTSATLQKLIVPAIFPSEELCMTVDAGMIFGRGLPSFIDYVNSNSKAPVTAFATDSLMMLQENQKRLIHNKLYPAGGILAFRPKSYNDKNLLERCVRTFSEMRQHIIYGEQDIICFTMKDHELESFPPDWQRVHIDLADEKSWGESDNLVKIYLAKNYLYMKHVGVFKPWLQWVLSPAKSIFINAASELPPPILNLTAHPRIRAQHATTDKFSSLFFERQLSLYEDYLKSSFFSLKNP